MSTDTPPVAPTPEPVLELVEVTNDVVFASVAIFGEQGTGKSRLGAGLAAFVAERTAVADGHGPLPIGVFDTERRSWFAFSPHLARLKKLGIKVLRPPTLSRRLLDALAFLKAARAAGCSVVLIDQVTHLRRDVERAYRLERKRTHLTPADREAINLKFREFTDQLVNLAHHTILVGRAADLYEDELEDELEDGERRSVKTGVRIDAGRDLGYEPLLVVEMERARLARPRRERGKLLSVTQRCTVVKDATGSLHGVKIERPAPHHFAAVFDALALDGAHAQVETEPSGQLFEDERAAAEEAAERKRLTERIEGLFATYGITGRRGETQRARALNAVFDTTSMAEVVARDLEELRDGVGKLDCELASPTVYAD